MVSAPIPDLQEEEQTHVARPGVAQVGTSLGTRPGKQPSAAGSNKGSNKPVSLHLVPEPRDPPLGAQSPQEKEPGKSSGRSPCSQPPSQAVSGSATHLPPQETCHPPAGQTAIVPKSPGQTCSPHPAPSPSWLLPLHLISSQEAETAVSFPQYCSPPSFPALLHSPLLQEATMICSALRCCQLTSSPYSIPSRLASSGWLLYK